MSRQVIQQPNAEYCIFSSYVDDFIVVNASMEEVITFFVQEAEDRIRDALSKKAPISVFTKTFEEAVSVVREKYGDDAESLQLLDIK